MAEIRLEGPIAGDPFQVTGAFDLAADGYVGEEFFLSGTAYSYSQVGAREDDGLWQAKRDGSSPFTTRILTRRPKDPVHFNGTVVIEWMNVSGGLDANVAARLETLAEPGGICISGAVFNNVKGKLDLGFADLGPQKVKNIRSR